MRLFLAIINSSRSKFREYISGTAASRIRQMTETVDGRKRKMLILRLYSQDKMNWLMAGFVVIWMIVLLAMYGKMHSGDEKKKNIWKMLCQVPLGLCVLHFIFGRFIGNAMLTGFSYGGFYLVAVWTACFPWLFRKKRKISKVILSAVLAVSGCFLTIAYPAIDNCGMRNYTHKNFEASFEAMVENMKQYDTLIDWKQIDVDQIAQQVKPLIQEAQQKDDPALFYTALCFRS